MVADRTYEDDDVGGTEAVVLVEKLDEKRTHRARAERTEQDHVAPLLTCPVHRGGVWTRLGH